MDLADFEEQVCGLGLITTDFDRYETPYALVCDFKRKLLYIFPKAA